MKKNIICSIKNISTHGTFEMNTALENSRNMVTMSMKTTTVKHK